MSNVGGMFAQYLHFDEVEFAFLIIYLIKVNFVIMRACGEVFLVRRKLYL